MDMVASGNNRQRSLLGHRILETEREIGAEEQDVEALDALIDTFMLEPESKLYSEVGKVWDYLKRISNLLCHENFHAGYDNEHFFDSLRNRSFKCYQGSLLYTTLLEAQGIHARVVLSEGHTHVGWRNDRFTIEWETTEGQKRTGPCKRKYFMDKEEILGFSYQQIGLKRLYRDNDPENASQYLEKAVQLFPHFTTYKLMSDALKTMGSYDDALDCMSTAIHLSPPQCRGELFHSRGLLWSDVRDDTSAVSDCFAAKEQEEQFCGDYFELPNMNIGISFVNMNDYSNAITYLSKVPGKSSKIHMLRGLCHEKLFNRPKAKDDFVKALRMNPEDIEARERLSNFF